MLHNKYLHECSAYAIKHSQKFCSSYLIGDGWDFYNSMNNYPSTGLGDWDSGTVAFNPALSNVSRFASGHSWPHQTGGSVTIKKTGSQNEQVWFITTAFLQTSSLAGGTRFSLGYVLYDGATPQASVWFREDGVIKFFSGDQGTEVASWNSAFVANSFDHYQFKLVISNTVGEVHARKNGNGADNFSATGLNLRVTANNYANGVALRDNSNLGPTQFFDDTFIYNGNVSSGPNDWVGDIRCIPLRPQTDSSVQFTRVSTGSLVFGTSSNTGTRSVTANTVEVFCPIAAPTQGGSFTSLTFETNAGFTGKMKIALYRSDGDKAGWLYASKPGLLVAVSNEVVNPVTGVNTATFASAVPVENGYQYSIGILSDTSFTMKGASFNTPDFQYATAYASGFPADLSGLTTALGTQRQYTIYCTLTATNAGVVSDFGPDDLVTYGNDSLVGDTDIYGLGDLPYVPNSIIGLNFRSLVAKSDAGGRSVDLVVKSGSSYGNLTGYNPLTTFTNLNTFKDLDPATGSPWGVTGVNAAEIGMKVAS